MREKKHYLILLFFILLVANWLVYRTLFVPDTFQVSMLDVGEGKTVGNVVLVRKPGGETILIDTGPDASILRTLGKELPPWQRRIDVVVLTSATIGSAGGLPEVLSRYQVSNLIRFGGEGSKALESTLAASVNSEKGLREIRSTKNQRLTFDADTYIDILSSQNGPASVYFTHGGTTTQMK